MLPAAERERVERTLRQLETLMGLRSTRSGTTPHRTKR